MVDKRKVRRDRADFFARSPRASRASAPSDWGLVDEVAPRSRFQERVRERAEVLAGRSDRPATATGVALPALDRRERAHGVEYRHVALALDPVRRVATLTVRAPDAPQPASPEEFLQAGATAWAFAAFRELDDALLHLRLNQPEIGLVLLRTAGDPRTVLDVDRAVAELEPTGSCGRSCCCSGACSSGST